MGKQVSLDMLFCVWIAFWVYWRFLDEIQHAFGRYIMNIAFIAKFP
jgi:hypothetical protein